MSYTPDKLVSFAKRFEEISNESLEKSAKKKEKVDPKAKVRNRGTACVPAESAKDKKDHFPINDEAQARNALARVHQYSSVPEWYTGSLKGLQALVARKVKAKYPKIDVDGKDSKKKKSAYYEAALSKYAQYTPAPPPAPKKEEAWPEPSTKLNAVTKEDLLTRLNAYKNELADKKRRNADNEPKQLAYDEADKAMTEAIAAANKDDFNTAYNRVSYADGKITRSGVNDPSFSQYAGELLTRITRYREQAGTAPGATPATSTTPAGGDNKTSPATTKPTTPAAKKVRDPRVVKLQTILRDTYKFPGADGKPLETDGIIGRNTRFAINSYKNEYNQPQATDAMAIYNILNTKPEDNKGRYGTPGAAGNAPAAPEPTIKERMDKGEVIPTMGTPPENPGGIVRNNPF